MNYSGSLRLNSALSVYDIHGNLLLMRRLDNVESNLHLSLSDIGLTETGIYIIRLESRDEGKVLKVRI